MPSGGAIGGRQGSDEGDDFPWREWGIRRSHVPGWRVLVKSCQVKVEEVSSWESAGVSPRIYEVINSFSRTYLTPERCRVWIEAGIPPRHVSAYEESGLSPAEVAPYGELMAEHPPEEIFEALGMRASSKARLPMAVLARCLGAGWSPFEATFRVGHRFPISETERASLPPHPYSYYERKRPPAISWSDAGHVLQREASSGLLLTLPSSEDMHDVPLMGTYHNEDRILHLRRMTPDGVDDEGRPWHVGILYMAPDDPVYRFKDLVGVVSRAGHIGCLMPGYYYIRPFLEALSQRKFHFLIRIVHVGNDKTAIRFERGRALRTSLEGLAPSNIVWEWPPWPSESGGGWPDHLICSCKVCSSVKL